MKEIKQGISVAMCTYNGFQYVAEQLESILNQTLLPQEIVICDDASTDHTVPIIEKFIRSSPVPVKLYRNQVALGVFQNFHKAISLCTGDYVVLSDQDDVWLPEKIESLLEGFRLNNNADLIFSDMFLVKDNLEPLNRTHWEYLKFTNERRKLWADAPLDYMLMKGNVVAGASLMINSRLKEKFIQLKDVEFCFLLHDYALALMAAVERRIQYVDKALVKYRQHTNQQVGTRRERFTLPRKLKFLRFAGNRSYNQTGIENLKKKLLELSALGITEQNSEFFRRGVEHLKLRTSRRSWFPRAFRLTKEFLKGRYKTYTHSSFMSYFNDLLTTGKAG